MAESAAFKDVTVPEAIIRVLEEAKAPLSAKEIAGISRKNYSTVRGQLRTLFSKGDILALNNQTYCLPGRFAEEVARYGIQPREEHGEASEDRKELMIPSDGSRRIRVPVFGSASAGPGRSPLNEMVEYYEEMAVSEFVLTFRRPPPSNGHNGIGFFKIVGSSAAPVYFDGELVPVELLPPGTQEFIPDTVYVFRWDGQVMLKRLRKIAGGQVEAQSLNPGLSAFVFQPSDEYGFAVLARVIEPEKQQLYAALVGRMFSIQKATRDVIRGREEE